MVFFVGSVAFFAVPFVGLVVYELTNRGKKYVTSINCGGAYS